MDLMLTSFGASHLPRRSRLDTDIFYRMPPATIATSGQQLMPDYALLLLADRMVLDQTTYDLLIRGSHFSYGNVALMLKALHDEGFIRLEDFDSIISANRQLLNAMLERDMQELNSWLGPLKQSVTEWRNFVACFQGPLRHDYYLGQLVDHGLEHEKQGIQAARPYRLGGIHAARGYHNMVQSLIQQELDRAENLGEHRPSQVIGEVIAEYLSYVNVNIVPSSEFGCGFYDWCDFGPFYRDKFLRVGRMAAPGQDDIENIKQLFAVSFPEFTFWTPENIIRALKDKRIKDLRALVSGAVRGDFAFDREFAIHVLTEVLQMFHILLHHWGSFP
jgi:hypothetical protein